MADELISFSTEDGRTKIKIDRDGYVTYARGFSFYMWSKDSRTNPDDELIGKNIFEVAKTIKERQTVSGVYRGFMDVLVEWGLWKMKKEE